MFLLNFGWQVYFLLGLMAYAGIACCLIAINTLRRELREMNERRPRLDKHFR